MNKLLRRLLGQTSWKKTWQDELSATLQEAQKGLNVSMIVAIAMESDFYAEVLYLLSFIGLTIGCLLAYFLPVSLEQPFDILLYPLAGFAIGSSLFQFRHFFLHRLAPRAVRERVANRAKALFFDHSQNVKGKLGVLYSSELEREVLFVSSPEILKELPEKELQAVLSTLIRDYRNKEPLKALRPALLGLGEILRRHFGAAEGQIPEQQHLPVYVGASDRPLDAMQVPILKGSKDIN